MGIVLELMRVAIVSTSQVETMFSKLKILRGDHRFCSKPDLLCFGLTLMLGPPESIALSTGLFREACDIYESQKPRRSCRQQRLMDAFVQHLGGESDANLILPQEVQHPITAPLARSVVEAGLLQARKVAAEQEVEATQLAVRASQLQWWNIVPKKATGGAKADPKTNQLDRVPGGPGGGQGG
jgi:hypothetical protein